MAKCNSDRSCSNSIIRNDEVSGPSPLLWWAGSSLCWNLSSQRVFGYITGFLVSSLGADIVEEKQSSQMPPSLAVSLMHLLVFIGLILLQSPLDTLWNVYGTGMVIVSCQRPREEEKFWDGIFHSKSERGGKERSLIPYTKLPFSPISVLCTQMNGEGFYGKNTLTFILFRSSSLPNWPKVLCAPTEGFMNSYFSPLSPGSEPLRCWWVRGRPEGKAVRVFCDENQVWLKSSSVSDMLSR